MWIPHQLNKAFDSIFLSQIEIDLHISDICQIIQSDCPYVHVLPTSQTPPSKSQRMPLKKQVFFLRILCLPFLHSLLLLRFKLRPAVFKVVIYLSVIKKWRDLIQAFAFLPSSMTDMVPSPNLYAYLPFLLAGAFLNKIFYLCFWLGDSETRYRQAYSPIYPWCKKAQ